MAAPMGTNGYGSAGGVGDKSRQKQALGLTTADLAKAMACILVPPLFFTVVTVLLCFRIRFEQPKGVWLVSALFLAPAAAAFSAAQKAKKRQEDSVWQTFAGLLFLLAYIGAAVVGELNYWYFSQPYFTLTSLKAYTEVNPSETDGARLMDAGTVHFTPGSRLALDMSMSYTSWDIYCVAPITTSVGLPTQGAQLTSYSLWAVGVNCCSSGETNFACGEYDKVDARAGLRQVSAEQRPYFRLAIEQAEAAYNIEATHPIFFYWVTDPVEEQNMFFSAAFANWVLAQGLHFGINAFLVLAFVVMFNKASKEANTHMLMALQS
mmetsp:Transcript_35640/g.90645  ORF Transcript_35640/g.90645 Transcript_35640/m.90645 type:complete len:321 (-) Transcript_35640:117-1079(-)|eukprot:CAMPEP_0183439186 /NCGR_PEP_ID=MMETSP0370-20130417/77855_1 /TAXON_ID=268820 /ORGANISM="Peridinium aciculiferum, Strain PAER-2" /LENGTH=320 /DNA_ID=CAMNT_0025627583 /DNA_START=1 /DNA_END=963 /DNA_ORIENTATION=+